MNHLFEKYFNQRDPNKGKAELVYDITENRISPHELEELINLMSKKGLLTEEAIDECEKNGWNERYLRKTYSRFLTGIFSASYLRYLAAVSSYVHKKRIKKNILLAIGFAIVAFFIAKLF